MSALLRVALPRDRMQTGTLVLLAGSPQPDEARTDIKTILGPQVAGPFPCLGKADSQAAAEAGNPSRDPLHPYGDFPLGGYSARLVEWPGPPGAAFLREYGPWGYIVLTPVSGEALAAQKNGRYGLRVHAGDPYPSGGLRPTHGCLRLSNDDFRVLAQALDRLAGEIPGPPADFDLSAAELPDVRPAT